MFKTLKLKNTLNFSSKHRLRALMLLLLAIGLISNIFEMQNAKISQYDISVNDLNFDPLDRSEKAPKQATSKEFGFIGSLDLTGDCYDFFITGDYGFIATDTVGLTIVNLTNPEDASVLGEIITPGRAHGVDVAGDFAYIADDENGLQCIDVSDPKSPILIGSVDTSGEAVAVKILGDTAFIADGSNGLVCINITNPFHPTILGFYNTTGYAKSLTVKGDTLYLTGYDCGLYSFDISDPSSPLLLDELDTPGWVLDVVISGNIAFIADYEVGLTAIDISNPRHMSFVGVNEDVHYVYGLDVVGNLMYVAELDYGLFMIDITTPAKMEVFQSYPKETMDGLRAVINEGSYTYLISSHDGLQCYYTANPVFPSCVADLEFLDDTQNIAIDGDVAYVCVDSYGLYSVNISNPFEFEILDMFSPITHPEKILLHGDVAFIFDYADTIYSINISDPTDLQLHYSLWDFSGDDFTDMLISGDMLYLSSENMGLNGYNISDPTDPELLFSSAMFDGSSQMEIDGDILYILGCASGIMALNISDPTSPVVISAYDYDMDVPIDMSIQGNIAYVTYLYNGIVALNISDPSHIQEIGTYFDYENYEWMEISGNLLIVSILNRIEIFDITNLDTTLLLGYYVVSGPIMDLAVEGRNIYCLAGQMFYTFNFLRYPWDILTLSDTEKVGFISEVSVSSHPWIANCSYLLGGEYRIYYENGTQCDFGLWISKTPFYPNFSFLGNGDYNLTLEVNDHLNPLVNDSFWLSIQSNDIPVLSKPADLQFPEGSTSQVVNWICNDGNSTENLARIFVNNELNMTLFWESGVPIAFPLDNFQSGLYSIICEISDGIIQENITDQVYVLISPKYSPYLNSPEDQTWVVGTTEASNCEVRWNPYDNVAKTGDFSILLNDECVWNGIWETNVPILYSIPALTVGTHNLTCEISDGVTLNISDTVIINIIANDVPTLSSPLDQTWNCTNLGHSIEWIPDDLYAGDFRTYSITRNETLIATGTWVPEFPICLLIEGLPPGVYLFKCIISDGFEESVASDEVRVLVKAVEETISTDDLPTGDLTDDSPSRISGYSGMFLLAAIAGIGMIILIRPQNRH